jgi:hypothetical protein
LTTPAPTYAKDVARIVRDNCETCHHPGTAAPFSLTTYDDAVKWGENIREAVSERRMPPWFADPRYGKFSNDRRLSPGDLDAILTWVDGGMLPGEEKDLPPPKAWENRWTIGTPDMVIDMPGVQDVPASGTVPYKIFSARVPWSEDVLVTAAEIIPGDRGVVHHAEVYIDDFVAMVASYAPGSQALVLPPETACRFPAGKTLTWLMHYTPNGKPTTDRSRVGFRFWKGKSPPKYLREIIGLQKLDIDIPPGSPDTVVENDWIADGDKEVISIRPHMHLRGKEFRLDATYPDGRHECLLYVPRYDFNWQITYEFAEPQRFPKGTRLHFTSHYDNSSANPTNPDPTKRVKWGQQTDDEMQTILLDCRFEYRESVAKTQPPNETDWLSVRVWTEVVGAELAIAVGVGLSWWKIRSRWGRSGIS